jgi:hypothetical protein
VEFSGQSTVSPLCSSLPCIEKLLQEVEGIAVSLSAVHKCALLIKLSNELKKSQKLKENWLGKSVLPNSIIISFT